MTGPWVDIWVDVAFVVFGLASVWFGWRVFVTDSMVRATFSLLVSFLNVGAIMVLLAAEYLGVAMFFMMAVEMTVMAAFMVAFMMNPAGLNPMQMVHQHKAAIVTGVASFLAVAGLGVGATFPDRPLRETAGTIRELGLELMGGSMLVMQTIGVTILATIVASVVLSTARGRFGDGTDGSQPPPLEPSQHPKESGGHPPTSPRATSTPSFHQHREVPAPSDEARP